MPRKKKKAIALLYSQQFFAVADYNCHNHKQLKHCYYIIETFGKIIAIIFFDLFSSVFIKQQERTVSTTTHQRWVCLSLHGQE